MQRKVKSTIITIAIVNRKQEGNYEVEEKVLKCCNMNEKNARKKVRKKYPDNIIISAEEIDEMYVMDDAIFFAHATLKGD